MPLFFKKTTIPEEGKKGFSFPPTERREKRFYRQKRGAHELAPLKKKREKRDRSLHIPRARKENAAKGLR